MDIKEISIRLIMFLSWILSISLSVYITLYKNSLHTSGIYIDLFLLLIISSALSCIISLVYMRYISPLRSAIDEWNKIKQNEDSP